MSAFFAECLKYVIEMIILFALGCCGAFIGIKLRKNKNKKQETTAE